MSKYIKNKLLRGIVYLPHNIKHTAESCYLCMRFPFLYPRNRFSGSHYTNWKFDEYIHKLYTKSHELGTKENDYKTIVTNKKIAVWHDILKWIHENPIQWLHFIPSYTELDAMDSGWRKTFGIQMCEEIKTALLDAGGRKTLKSYRIAQIKEKYGALCWYDCGATKDVQKIIEKYEYISARTCIDCGKPAAGMTIGWIEPYCEECAKKRGYDIEDEDCFDKYGTKENPWYGYYSIVFDKKDKETKDSSTNL